VDSKKEDDQVYGTVAWIETLERRFTKTFIADSGVLNCTFGMYLLEAVRGEDQRDSYYISIYTFQTSSIQSRQIS
jgi:hypothetical protein